MTGVDCLRRLNPTRQARIGFVCIMIMLWVIATLLGGRNAIDVMALVLTVVLYLLVPWTSVNLVDYFFVRKGNYAVTHLFKIDGIYGRWGRPGLTAYLFAWVAMVPFAVLPNAYMGPLARTIGGVDVAGLVGLLVAGFTYRFFTRSFSLQHEQAAIAESNKELEDLVKRRDAVTTAITATAPR
jgi:purine-cytosine permease-like protein